MRKCCLELACLLMVCLTGCGGTNVAETPAATEVPAATEAPIVTEAPTAVPTPEITPEPTPPPRALSAFTGGDSPA